MLVQRISAAETMDRHHAATILAEVARISLRKPVGLDQPLMESGLNANRGLALIKEFWLRTNIELDVNVFYRYPTLGAIAEAIETGAVFDVPKILTLRAGDPRYPLYFFAGGASCFLEIEDLLDGLDWPGEMLGIRMSMLDANDVRNHVVATEIAESAAAVRERSPNIPIGLIGFSLGGVFAMELARALEQDGGDIRFLAMIDTPIGHHAWPFSDWLSFTAKRVAGKLKSVTQHLAKRQPAQPAKSAKPAPAVTSPRPEGAPPSPPRKGNALLFRYFDPLALDYPLKSPYWVGDYPPQYDAFGRQLIRMRGQYRPQAYAGPLVFYRSKAGSPIDCDPKLLWSRLLAKAEWVDVSGNHLSMMLGRNAKALGADISEKLSDSLTSS